MATKGTRKKASPKRAAKRPKAKKKPTPKRTAKPTAKASADDLATLREELDEARAELARIATEENSARRTLEMQSSLGRSVEERLRAELEAIRTDLRTALADLEIAQADHDRAESKLIEAVRELSTARENERLAAHASADARDRLLDLERENQRLRAQLEARAEHDEEETTPKLKENGGI
jgi:chromosome segregation ATPase